MELPLDPRSKTNPPKLTPPSFAPKKKEIVPVNKKSYDIFLSYRRSDGSELARYLVEELTKKGFHVFLDSEGLESGAWDTQLEQRIDECRDFIVLITKAYFDPDRINKPDDVVRKEVARALLNGTNVIPLLASTPPFPDKLPKDIEEIQRRNGVKYFHEYAKEAIEKLCTRLVSTPLIGPERLYTPEVQPKVIVGLVGAFFGGALGKVLPSDPSGLGMAWSLLCAIGNGLIIGVIWSILLGVPIFVALAVISHVKKIRRDALYGGPWIPFWVVFIFTLSWASPLIVEFVFQSIGLYGDFLGGLIGGASGICVAGIFSYTKIYEILSTMLKGKAR